MEESKRDDKSKLSAETLSSEMKKKQRLHITEMLKQHEEFIVVGLTGRVGSGCSAAAEVLGQSFQEIGLPPIYPGDQGLPNDNARDRRILYRYASHHWLKFDIIKVRTIITSYLLEDMSSFCSEVAKYLYPKEEDKCDEIKSSLLNGTFDVLRKSCPDDCTISSQLQKVQDIYSTCDGKSTPSILNSWGEGMKELERSIISWTPETADKEFTVVQLSEIFDELYGVADKCINYAERIKLLREVDSLLNILADTASFKWWEQKIGEINEKTTGEELSVKIYSLAKIGEVLKSWTKMDKLDFFKYIVVHNILPVLSDTIHDCISKDKGSLFTELFQKYGNSIRKNGKIVLGEVDPTDTADTGASPFSIPRRINKFIKSIRHPFSRFYAKPTRIVIDAIKSVLEANYLRDRYSAFYLFAISTEESVRVNRLTKDKNLNLREIHCINWNEYSNQGAEIYQKYLSEKKKLKAVESSQSEESLYKSLKDNKIFDDDEIAFIKKVEGNYDGESERVYDPVRKDAYENKMNQFVLQDVGASIQNADVFISNNHQEKTKNMDLRWEIVRNICLVSHPGLLLPTPIERCMQAAFTAKANSGCLSRQVGAVVTDSDYNILSIGWNDVPCGDISCSRKNLADIYGEQDLQAYTDYEIRNGDFRDRVSKIYMDKTNSPLGHLNTLLCGLPWRYCFKDIHIDGKQPMRSRAMHAEEKALSYVHENAIGGCLFTTSSPCEMCSKNAKNHRIKKIYYIEPYPGISEDQYSNSGNVDNRAEHILFTGAIGRAYTQMYTPILPQKDILEFLGL